MSISEKIMSTLQNSALPVVLQDEELSFSPAALKEAIERQGVCFAQCAPAGGRVGICVPDSAALAIAILSVLVSGRVPVILNSHLLQPSFQYRLSELRLHALLIPETRSADVETKLPTILTDVSGKLRILKDFPQVNEALPHSDTCMILCTSGSQGEPRAVQFGKDGVMYVVDKMIAYFKLDSDSIAAVTLPLSHTMGLHTQFLPTFFAGGKIVMHSCEMGLGRIFRSLHQTGGNFVSLISDMVSLCHDEMNKRDIEPLMKVRHVQIAGGIINSAHLSKARDLFPNARIHKGYGLTEAMRVCMIDSTDPLFSSDCVGKLFEGQEIQIRDKRGAVLPADAIGQIYVRGPNVMVGYDGLANAMPADGFFPTGDLGSMTPEKYLRVFGRIDSIFKSQGKRIAGWELEQAALAMPQIRRAKCLPVKCHVKGLRPILFVEAEASLLHEEETRHAFEKCLRKNLESYKLPRDVVVMSEIPRTANGKVSKPMLEKQWVVREKTRTCIGIGEFGCRFWE